MNLLFYRTSRHFFILCLSQCTRLSASPPSVIPTGVARHFFRPRSERRATQREDHGKIVASLQPCWDNSDFHPDRNSSKWRKAPYLFLLVLRGAPCRTTTFPFTRVFRFTRGFLILFVVAYPAFSNARHMYHDATVRYGLHRSPNFSNSFGRGLCLFP